MTSAPSVIRLLIADDQGMIRGGLRALLESAADIDVIGEAADGEQAIALTARQAPDVILMDIRMPGIDGWQATRRIHDQHPSVTVIVLTTFDLNGYVFEAVRAGAVGFLLKDGDADDLVLAVRTAARGDALMAPQALRRLPTAFAATKPEGPGSVTTTDQLTPREREVMVFIALGMTNAEIAERPDISDTTAKTHIGNLLAKLQARNRAQLVVAAYENGLVSPGRASS